MIAKLSLCVYLMYLVTTYGFVMTLSKHNIDNSKIPEQNNIGSLYCFETTISNGVDGSRTITSKKTYRHEINGHTTYTMTDEKEYIPDRFQLNTTPIIKK